MQFTPTWTTWILDRLPLRIPSVSYDKTPRTIHFWSNRLHHYATENWVTLSYSLLSVLRSFQDTHFHCLCQPTCTESDILHALRAIYMLKISNEHMVTNFIAQTSCTISMLRAHCRVCKQPSPYCMCKCWSHAYFLKHEMHQIMCRTLNCYWRYDSDTTLYKLHWHMDKENGKKSKCQVLCTVLHLSDE